MQSGSSIHGSLVSQPHGQPIVEQDAGRAVERSVILRVGGSWRRPVLACGPFRFPGGGIATTAATSRGVDRSDMGLAFGMQAGRQRGSTHRRNRQE
jgi:hypothetical protein